jgi:hypothetical protein
MAEKRYTRHDLRNEREDTLALSALVFKQATTLDAKEFSHWLKMRASAHVEGNPAPNPYHLSKVINAFIDIDSFAEGAKGAPMDEKLRDARFETWHHFAGLPLSGGYGPRDSRIEDIVSAFRPRG